MKRTKVLWIANDGGQAPDLPEKSSIPKGTCATFAAPAWTIRGWAADSPGFVWWYSQYQGGDRQLIFGEQMFSTLLKGPCGNAYATKAHAFAHRYPVAKETWKDKQTWHCGVLIEWSHGLFTTLIELAWLNGCSGYNGRSNWIPDKLETPTQLDVAMPAGMKCPWDSSKSEIRIVDMPLASLQDFEGYLKKYSREGDVPVKEQRFVDPKIYDSGDVRLRGCTPSHMAGFMLNYVSRAGKYVEWDPKMAQNCQTFAADVFSFLTGKKDAKPFGALIQAVYSQRNFSFLYMPQV